MKQLVSDLQVYGEVLSFFFVPEAPQLKQSKKKTDYLCIKLQDKSGVVDGRV